MSKEEILNDMLASIPNTYDKRPGSFIFDALAPVAEQLAEKDAAIQNTEDKLSIESLSGEELENRVKERTGIVRREATKSIGTVTVEGNGTINAGDLFETEDGIQFEATEIKVVSGTGDVSIQALVSGPIGVVAAESIILFPVTLAGITSVTNNEPTLDGFEAESDADLLQRYYDRIRTPSTSGNRFNYLNWAKEVQGVGEAEIFPLWNGDNTVKVVIIDSDRQPASIELVEEVQDYIDPGITGLGDGEAPIGAFATVVSAIAKDINIQFSLTLVTGFTEAEIIQNVENNITDYLFEIAFKQDFVSYAQIGSIILNSEGVADYTNLTVNNGTANISINDDEVAVLGGVVVV